MFSFFLLSLSLLSELDCRLLVELIELSCLDFLNLLGSKLTFDSTSLLQEDLFSECDTFDEVHFLLVINLSHLFFCLTDEVLRIHLVLLSSVL